MLGDVSDVSDVSDVGDVGDVAAGPTSSSAEPAPGRPYEDRFDCS